MPWNEVFDKNSRIDNMKPKWNYLQGEGEENYLEEPYSIFSLHHYSVMDVV